LQQIFLTEVFIIFKHINGWPTLCRVLKTNCNNKNERKQLLSQFLIKQVKLAVSSVKLAILHIETKTKNLLQMVKKRSVSRTNDF